ncbi:hypothetical protein K469DRAFT_335884 [Zopfia rhizophila CBS 207.26]|uniref:Uncharacterized protein n=1 Tax=Zopfia rhizophila CBS 207.26 TaxID=1314779 RepID=A0A6A6DJ93_9PEZI|nr:hypothetical protein K469DRAFT_335884 [Zopfia rhizophila CBS 207.26]
MCADGDLICEDLDVCAVTADCDVGLIYVVDTCCGKGVCVGTSGYRDESGPSIGGKVMRRARPHGSSSRDRKLTLGGFLV